MNDAPTPTGVHAQPQAEGDACLPVRHPSSGEGVQTALRALYSWDYDAHIDQIRTLYANALHAQWIALRDLDWETEIDREAFTSSFPIPGLPLQKTRIWQSLAPETRWTLTSNVAAFMLSNFLHGEQGALMVAGQLVNAVPDLDAKFYAATQTLDEARHVEVFSAYIQRLGGIQPIAPAIKGILDRTLEIESWMHKAVGMQVVTEGLALFNFRGMRTLTREPLLHKLLVYVSRDEARHTAYGIRYLSRVVPQLSERERGDLEDFAFETARILIDSRTGPSLRDSIASLMLAAGIDLGEMLADLGELRRSGALDGPAATATPGAVRGFIIPTLRTIGLWSERIESHFDDVFSRMPNMGFGPLRSDRYELPKDLEAWAVGESEVGPGA
jgi:hypothetical protein